MRKEGAPNAPELPTWADLTAYLRLVMRRTGKTQAQISKECGVSQSTLSRILAGLDRPQPRYDHAYRVWRFLKAADAPGPRRNEPITMLMTRRIRSARRPDPLQAILSMQAKRSLDCAPVERSTRRYEGLVRRERLERLLSSRPALAGVRLADMPELVERDNFLTIPAGLSIEEAWNRLADHPGWELALVCKGSTPLGILSPADFQRVAQEPMAEGTKFHGT